MAKSKQFVKELRFGVTEELHRNLVALSERRGERVAEVCRRILEDAVKVEAAKDGIDVILELIRQTVAEQMKPVEERMAKINAKTSIASATSMFMEMQIYKEFGKDPRPLYEAARKKAVAYIKQPNEQLMSEHDG